ncbi:YciI family protein [Jannaschia sp. R86511]|uniref:YciI family protein n=1 Tax=Jannaschia sp. R86511 TaxID=3093853 RepID=UPI0036D2B10D
MRFMMFVAEDDHPDTDPAPGPDVDTWVADHDAAGRRLLGEVLEPAAGATTVRVRDGRTLVTTATVSGPILGFDVLECADPHEAVAVAAAHPMARYGRIELRAFAGPD